MRVLEQSDNVPLMSKAKKTALAAAFAEEAEIERLMGVDGAEGLDF